MIKWFFSLFGLREEIPKTRSVEDGQPLTPWEVEFLIKHEGQKCPDCEKGQLLFIAEACGMINVRCERCQAKLNVADGGSASLGNRIAVGVKNFDPRSYRG